MRTCIIVNRISVLLSILLFMFTACHSLRKTSESNVSVKQKEADYKNFSEKLGFKVDNNCNIKLIKESVSWLGVPYKFGGSSRTGIDCSGLVCNIYIAVYGKKVPRTAGELFEQSTKIKEDKLQEGDLVFFNYDGKKASHVGIFLKETYFVHASTKKGVMIGDLNDPYNKKYFLKGGRIP